MVLVEKTTSPIENVGQKTRKMLENVGAGKGHLSTVHLVQEGDNVFILKVPIIEQSKLLASPIKKERFEKMHNTEVDVYNLLSKHPEANVLHPKIFDTQKVDLSSNPPQPGLIAMEHISNCTTVFLNQNLKAEDLIEPLKNMARFHALGFKLTDDEKKLIPKDMIKTWFAELFCPPNMEMFLSVWKNNTKIILSDEASEGINILPEVLSYDNLLKFNDICTLKEIPAVMCHGDFWSPNLLFQLSENGSMIFKSLCDFQTCNWGSVGQDLTRLMCTTLSGKDRRDNYKELIKVYHNELVEIFGSTKVPLSLEMVEQCYDQIFPLHAAVMCVPTPGRLLIKINEIEDKNEREKMMNLISEKYRCALEDMKNLWEKRNI